MKLWPENWWPRKRQVATTAKPTRTEPAVGTSGFFSTDLPVVASRTPQAFREYMQENAFQVVPAKHWKVRKEGPDGAVALDSFGDDSINTAFGLGQSRISPLLGAWYVSQGFIGYQTCAILAQQWLVDKACTQAPKDAARNGYRLTVNDGSDVDPKTLAAIAKWDRKFKVAKNLVEFARFNRVFGIRVALFDVRSSDPLYYEKPFNIDGVEPGSYKGISQVDPYWMTPELDWNAAANPASREFYEPTFWVISGRRYHRSHLVLIRGPEVPDILKPSYLYGGLPLTQRIYERVYAAERSANEAPQLLLSKRTTFIKTDTAAALSNQQKFEERMRYFSDMRDNFALGVVGEKEEPTQFDTTLSDLDSVIMTQYQLVAAIANTPATKLLGTSPKGFNATGDYDAKSYHEELKSIQTHEMEPLLERHYQLLIKSHIAPQSPFAVEIEWEAVDAPGAKEVADIEESKARTAQIYHDIGAVDSNDVRSKITADPASGFNGLPVLDPLPEPEEEPATDGGTPEANAILQNLSGRQYQQVVRVMRNHAKGALGTEQAGVLLKGGFGLTDTDVATLLGVPAAAEA